MYAPFFCCCELENELIEYEYLVASYFLLGGII